MSYTRDQMVQVFTDERLASSEPDLFDTEMEEKLRQAFNFFKR